MFIALVLALTAGLAVACSEVQVSKKNEKTYTVTYYYNYDGAPNSGVYRTDKVDANTAAKKPANPTRSGDYTFIDWTVDATGKISYNFSALVSVDLKLYAQWRDNSTVAPTLTDIDAAVTKQYKVGDTFSKSDITVTAKYSDNTERTVTDFTYSPNPDMSTAGQKTITVSYGGKTKDVKFTVSARPVERVLDYIDIVRPTKKIYTIGEELDLTGLKVTAVYTDESEENVEIADCIVTGYDKDALGDQMIIVTYGGKFKTFTVTVANLESVQIITEPDTTNYDVGDRLDLTGIVVTADYGNDETIIYTDYLTEGDFDVSGFDSSVEGECIVTISYKGYEDSFIVYVTRAERTVNFVTGVAGMENPAAQTVDKYAKIEEPDGEFDREGYTFDGWFRDGETEPYDFDTEVTEYFTLTAKWTAIEYVINYVIENDAEGNPYATAPEKVSYTIEDAVDLLDPTDIKEGYTFIGWFDALGEDEAGNVVYDYSHKVTGIELGSTGEKTFYAYIAEIKTYTVTFNYNYDETPITKTVNVQEGTTATALNPAPTRTGYNFDGWYKEAACLNAWDFETETVAEDVELFAKWNIAVYTVTFDADNGEEEHQTQQVEYNKLATKPANPDKYPYTFGGWMLNGSLFDFNTPITEDVTLVANWWYDVQYGSFLHIRANDSSAWKDDYGASSHNEDSEWKVADVKLQVGTEFLVVEHGEGWDNWYNAQDGFTQWNATDVITVAYNDGNFKVTKMASGYANLTWTLYIKKDGWGISLVPRNANEKRSPAVTNNVTWEFRENRPNDKIFIAGTFTDGFKYHKAWSTESTAVTVLKSEWGIYTFRHVYLKKNDAFKIVDNGAWLSGSFEALDTVFELSDGYSEDIALTSISNGWYDIVYNPGARDLRIKKYEEATLSEIKAELRNPNKTYYVGCTIAKTDLLVKTVNTDGKEALISAYTINHPDTSTPGEKWFSVSYGGLEGWVKVDVKNTKSGAFLYILTDVAAGKWEEKYSVTWQEGDYGAEWKVTGVKLQQGTKFLVVDYKEDGTDWYHSSGEYFGHNYENILTIAANGDNYEVTWIDSAYINASWTMTIKLDGTYVYLELPQNGVEKRTPDGNGTLTFGENVGDKIYIAGNFTDDFKYHKDWSTESTKMTVLHSDGVYVFRGVYLKQGDRFKIVNNGNWLGGNFSAVGAQFDVGDGGDITLFALTNGKYDLVYDSVNNKLTIRAYAATTLSGIELIPPAKTEYTLGEDLDTAGMSVKAVYSNGDKSNVALSACTVTGYNKAQKGSQTVTVTYQGKFKTFTVQVNEPQSSYTVTFDAKGGSEVEAQDVDYGTTVSKPADPTKYGYIFGGWYKDENCTVEWNFDSDKVTSVTTLYAKWTEDETVGYYLHILTDVNADKWEDLDAVINPENGGEVIIDGVRLQVGTKFLVYKGNNWYHAIEDDFTQYGGYDDIITIGVEDGNYIVTAIDSAYVDAVWKLYVKKYDSNSISIELSRNADESRATDGEGTLTFGERPNDKIFIAGNFTGGFMYHQDWSTDSEAITVLNNNGVYTFRGVYLKKNDAFKIVDNNTWKGGNFVAVGTELNLDNDRNVTLISLTDGLYDIVYDSVNGKLTVKTYVPAAIESIAIKTEPTKTTYFKGEDFDDEGLVVTATDTEGLTKVIEGYTLSGNNTSTLGTVTVTVTYGTFTATFDIEVSMINVTFMDGETELTALAATAEYNATLTAPEDLTKEGFTFGGWYKEAACTNAWNFATDKVTNDTTLYAKWTEDGKTGTFLHISLDGTNWEDKYNPVSHNYDAEWKVEGVKLQVGAEFVVVRYDDNKMFGANETIDQ
ncbi:MAG: InlB B-repeat-containing protein, partial [Clostridiales bacterium]|nr:InlB B-repeat-containing protein [Clostridiales bacterium]